MNSPEAVHCSACGAELGLQPLSGISQLSCPRCSIPLDGFGAEDGTLHDCGRCGGQFVDHTVLATLVRRHEAYTLPYPRHVNRANPLADPVRYWPCPACGSLMMRRNFGKSSGVVVDVCFNHGTWFDVGELPRILSFVAAGGLRAVALDGDAPPSSLRAVSLHSPSSVGSPSPRPLTGSISLEWADIAEAAAAFAVWVKEHLSNR